jgi:hypothetical protein
VIAWTRRSAFRKENDGVDTGRRLVLVETVNKNNGTADEILIAAE